MGSYVSMIDGHVDETEDLFGATDAATPSFERGRLSYEDRVAVYKKAIVKYGVEKQMTVAIEEMSEVIKELCKLQRGIGNRDHLAEEIADAMIVLEQMRLVFNLNQAVCDKMDEKIEDLQRKVTWE